MEDFAFRAWDSENEEMIVVSDLSKESLSKIKNENIKVPPMIASTFYDFAGVRLFENDIVTTPTKSEYKGETLYYVIKLDSGYGWQAVDEIGITWAGNRLQDRFVRNDMYREGSPAHPESVKYLKCGNIYSESSILSEAKKLHEKIKEVMETEKELKCLVKLKAKYEVV